VASAGASDELTRWGQRSQITEHLNRAPSTIRANSSATPSPQILVVHTRPIGKLFEAGTCHVGTVTRRAPPAPGSQDVTCSYVSPYIDNDGWSCRRSRSRIVVCAVPPCSLRGGIVRAHSPRRADEGPSAPHADGTSQASDGEYPSYPSPSLACQQLPISTRVDAIRDKQYHSTGIAHRVKNTAYATHRERPTDTYPLHGRSAPENPSNTIHFGTSRAPYGEVGLAGRASGEGSSAASAQMRSLT
jgi:hypothetical protein